jgi:nicotinate-nucleotide--dimethylbenzimidazole phosphoribosyltransferase
MKMGRPLKVEGSGSQNTGLKIGPLLEQGRLNRLKPQALCRIPDCSKKSERMKLLTDHPACLKTEENIMSLFEETLSQIQSPNTEIQAHAQHKIDFKTKPLGSLGYLEELAVRFAVLQNNLNPALNNKCVIVFAADHGICEEGVSAFPSEVTRQMVLNFLNGGAAINVLSKQTHADLFIADMGVNGNSDFPEHPQLITRSIRESLSEVDKTQKGTRNFAHTAAMTKSECQKALEAGIEIFNSIYDQKKIDVLAVGEMGIGNTTSATAIIASLCGLPVEELTGRGTGVDDKGLEHKIKVLNQVMQTHKLHKGTPALEVLQKVGGFEIAGMAGACLAAASKGVPIVLDGVISTAAGLIAKGIKPEIQKYFISGHKSVEPAQSAALSEMQLKPVVDLGMRLGEGSGAAITLQLCETACAIMREMASFEEAGVSEKS